MRQTRLVKDADAVPRSRRRPGTGRGPQRPWRTKRLAVAAIAVAVAVISAAPTVAGAATAHHSLADNGVISSHN
jgi:hypothetical protein